MECHTPYYIPIHKSPYEEDRFYIEICNSMYPVVLNGDTCYIDNFKYETESVKYDVVSEGENLFIEVTLESINKTFSMTEEELDECSTVLSYITPQIEYSEDDDEFWDELTNKFLEENPMKYSEQERMDFLRACGITQIEHSEEELKVMKSIPDDCKTEDDDYFPVPVIKDKELADFFGKLKSKMTEDNTRKASPEKIKELQSRLGL